MNAASDAATSAAFGYVVDPDFPQLPAGRPLGEVPGVAVDHLDRVYVVNRSAVPVQRYATDGRYLSAWPDNDFSRVHSITLGADGLIFITDDLRHVVRGFDESGVLMRTLGTPGVAADTGVEDSAARTVLRAGPPFNQPTDVAVAADGSLFVTDGYGNARVHHFTPAGELLASWGAPGKGPGEFHLPHGIAINTEGLVLVADRENNRFQGFAPDGRYEREYGDLIRPCGLYIDGEGTIYVAELGDSHGRITIMRPDGAVLARWPIVGEVPKAGAHSVALDSEGNLYVGLVYQGEPPPANARPVIKYRKSHQPTA